MPGANTTNKLNTKGKLFSDLSNSVHSPRDSYHKLSGKRERIPVNLTDGSHIAPNTTKKANLLNNFFSSCFSPRSADCLSPNQNHLHHVSMIEVPCTAEEVHKLLTTYKAKTSSGPDGISSAMLRNTADAIALHLTALFNLSLQQGRVPTAW